MLIARLRRLMITFLYLFAALYLLACLALWFQQRKLLYFPQPAAKSAMAESFMLSSGDEQLKIWHLVSDNLDTVDIRNRLAILYFDGNASATEYNLPNFQQQLTTPPLNADVYIMNYRGYGGSSGKPTEQELTADGLALYDYVRQLGHERIVIIGRSLGSGVATHIAAHRIIEKLVLVTAYDSIVNVAAARFPIFPVHTLMIDQFRSVERVPKIDAPTLLLTAAEDQVIRRPHTAKLKAAFPPEQVREEVFSGRHHGDIQLDPDYFPTLIAFLE